MADLETAADAALVKVKQLSETAERAEGVFTALEQQLSRVAAQLESDWSGLSADAQGLLQKLQDEKARLAQERQEADDAFEGLKQTLANAHSEEEQELSGAKAEVSALEGAVDGFEPQLAEMVQEVEQTARSLKDRAAVVEDQLQDAVADGRGLFTDLINDLEIMQDAIQDRGQDLQHDMVNDCQAALQDKYENWAATLNDVEDLVEQAFEDSREHVEQVIEYSLAECAKAHADALDEVAGMVGNLVTAAEKLERAIEARQMDLEQARGGLREDLGETRERLDAMTAALNGIKELMASFSFVQI